MPSFNELTDIEHWDRTWAGGVRLALPSGLVVSTRNLQRLLSMYVRPGDRFLEVGCAPGKILAWVAAALHAEVSGLDYSESGLATSKRLFRALRLAADLRCENLFATTFPPASFDVVYSTGLIEHFDDPREAVRAHLRLVKPGGTAVVAVPNYGGVYGVLQRYFDPENLKIHNLDIMSCDRLLALVPADESASMRAYTAGRISPWIVNISKRWPAPLATGLSYAVNAVALLQPFDVPTLSPMLVLEIRRRAAA